MAPRDMLSEIKGAKQPVMHHFHYTVRTHATPALAWDVYSNCNLWPKFASIYGELKWTQGKPWEVGSRMQIEILRPVKTVIDHLIICCEPARELGWIDRALGMTMSQWVEFEPLSAGDTRVHTWGELSSSDLKVGGCTAAELLSVFTETWYENYRLACDALAAMATST
jgi:hypothetical protein